MKNKKGFTLTEVIAVIVILAVIILLAMAGYNGVTRKVKETTYENKKTLIETKAAEYANNTGFTSTNVDNLVKNGYIQADDEAGNVYNPVDGKKINCKVVYINKENDNLYGNYTETEECDNNSLKNENMYLKIEIYKTTDNVNLGGRVEKDKWVKENVILVTDFTSTSIPKGEVERIIWTTNTGREEVRINNDFASKNKHLVTAEQIINTSYGVEVLLKDGTSYQTSTNVKIDKQRPIIYANEIEIDRENEWTAGNKEVVIKASDGQGSGIYGYSIRKDNADCKTASYEEHHEESYKKSLDEGRYYVCVRDNVGNLSEDRSSITFTIDKIDREEPRVTVKNDPLTLGNVDYEFKDNLNVTWGPSGEGSISCNPAVSKKTGVYTVTCDVTGNNGLSVRRVCK